ncbi:MAG: hypothetical protein WA910_04195 [Sphingopyxis granuli]
MHRKRGRSRNQRAGCKLCKPWKVNGISALAYGSEKFGDHARRMAARRAMADV